MKKIGFEPMTHSFYVKAAVTVYLCRRCRIWTAISAPEALVLPDYTTSSLSAAFAAQEGDDYHVTFATNFLVASSLNFFLSFLQYYYIRIFIHCQAFDLSFLQVCAYLKLYFHHA